MDELNENDSFVLSGKKVILEKGQRYRIVMRDGRIFEGIFDGCAVGAPWSHTVTLKGVVQMTQNGVVNLEHLFMSFEKARIGSIEKSECDLLSIAKMIDQEDAQYNYRKRTN